MVSYRVAHTNQPAVTFMKLDNFDNLLTPERMERLNTLSPKAVVRGIRLEETASEWGQHL